MAPALAHGAGESPPPNIVFILADDLGYGDLSCYGQTQFRTPHADRLAAEGMRFTDFYAGAPICSPSRCVFMTGLHTGHARIRGNTAMAGGLVGRKGTREVRRAHLAAEDQTVADVLRTAGYRTCMIGKWHLDGFNPAAGPLDRGFDEFYGWLVSAPTTYDSPYYPRARFENRKLQEVPANRDGKRAYYHADMCVDEATEFLKRQGDAPFFLYLALNLPHSPLEAPDLEPYADKDWPPPMKAYAAMVDRLDRAVGTVLQALEAQGLDRRTIVFFCSDNGPRSEPTEELTSVAEFFNSNGPLRGYKRDLTEGGIRVPMIVRWPGHVPAGSTSVVPAYFADVLPTLAELSGAELKTATDGVSLVPILCRQKKLLDERFLYWEDFEGGFSQAVRWKNWKAIRPGRDAPLELYDLSDDVSEARDVAARHGTEVHKIEQLLSTARTDSENWPVGNAPYAGPQR